MNDGANQRPPSGLSPVGPDQSSFSLDTVLELLANQRRRFCLYSLTDCPDGEIHLDALVEEVGTLEAGLTGKPFSRDLYVDVASDLYHWHLEVLADVSIVEVDDWNGIVRYHGNPLLETWLNRVRQSDLSR